MKEIKHYPHWEEEITSTALDFKPVSLIQNWLNSVWGRRIGPKIGLSDPRKWQFIDQILTKRS